MEPYDTDLMVQAFQYLNSKQSVVEDTHGNISFKLNDEIVIKPSGVEYNKIYAGDLVHVFLPNLEHAFGTTRLPSVDLSEHAKIYARNSHVNAICHTHSPYATAWATMSNDLPVIITEHADYFGHTIRRLPYRPYDEWGDITLLPGEQAVLLGNHGVLIATDGGPLKAAKLAVALESICKKYAIAATFQVQANMIPDDEVIRWHERYRDVYGQR